MSASTIAACPPITQRDAPFTSLGAIDRIGHAFCRAAQDFQRINDVQTYRAFRMRCLKTTLTIVDACNVPERATVSVRLKRLDSIRRKIGRPDTKFTLGRLDDVVGVRVICQEPSTVRDFSDRIKSSPYFHRIKDYITTPAATGYRGINHIMRLEQPVTTSEKVTMRFEIQARTYLQHRWAVFSESHGEAVKLGAGADADHQRLRALSQEIARWETDHPDVAQVQLPSYSGGRSIAVCWRTRHGPATFHYFQDDVQSAVDWLNHLETTYPSERENALLLVGVTQVTATQRVLQLTHPLFTGARLLDPRFWMPRSAP